MHTTVAAAILPLLLGHSDILFSSSYIQICVSVVVIFLCVFLGTTPPVLF
jgi:hypothetical protein